MPPLGGTLARHTDHLLVLQAYATGSVTLTAADQDVTGATVTFTVAGNLAVATCLGLCDFVANTSTGTTCMGSLYVDGAAQTAQALYVTNVNGGRQVVAQAWQIPLPAGTHTIKLAARQLVAGGNYQVVTNHSGLTVFVTDPGA